MRQTRNIDDEESRKQRREDRAIRRLIIIQSFELLYGLSVFGCAYGAYYYHETEHYWNPLFIFYAVIGLVGWCRHTNKKNNYYRNEKLLKQIWMRCFGGLFFSFQPKNKLILLDHFRSYSIFGSEDADLRRNQT